MPTEPPPGDALGKHISRIVFALTVVLIVYGSLYPFSFSRPPAPALTLDWPQGRGGMRDILLNIVLYLPAGFFLVLSIGRFGSGGRFLIALAGGCALSAAIEYIQSYDHGRSSSSIDLLMNGCGSALGALAGLRIGGWLLARAVMDKINGPAVALIALWMASELYPLVPNLHWSSFVLNEQSMLRTFHAHDLLLTSLEWLIVACLLTQVVPRPVVPLALAACTLAVPLKLVLMDRTTSMSELLGAFCAIVIAAVCARSPRFSPATFVPVMLIYLLLRELWPLHLLSQPQPFGWVPMAALIATPKQSIAVVFLQKSSVYGAAVWAWDPQMRRPWMRGTAIALGLLGLEWLQRYLPGRSPEITDSILVCLMTLTLWLLRPRGSREIAVEAGSTNVRLRDSI